MLVFRGVFYILGQHRKKTCQGRSSIHFYDSGTLLYNLQDFRRFFVEVFRQGPIYISLFSLLHSNISNP